MICTVPGHTYELSSFEGSPSQELQFIHKVLVSSPVSPNERAVSGELTTLQDGTTNEEVLAVLIDRMQFLQAKMPCRENAIVITKLEECLMWLNKRTEERKVRSVEGRHVA